MKSLHEDEVKGLHFTAFEEEKLFCFFSYPDHGKPV